MAKGMGNADNLDWAGFYPSASSSSMEPGHKVLALVDIVCTYVGMMAQGGTRWRFRAWLSGVPK